MNKWGVHTEFGYRPFQDKPHSACNGTGRIPDPRYAALREVLVGECCCKPDPGGTYHYHPSCPCGDSGRVLRDVSGWSVGALAGALLRWAAAHWVELRGLGKESDEAKSVRLLMRQLVDCFYLPNCDEAAVFVVIVALEKEK